jgi:butyryl-CoA dehydrogenase
MGWRGTTSTVLSFGEHGGAVGWLVGQPHQGLAHMFQMMNEARIGVGLSAASLAWRGFSESLAYARERPQGRKPSNRDATSPQVKLVEHADVRRMLLAQKCYAEGALGLCLYASALFEDQHTHPDSAMRARARSLLDLLTPVVKSWSSRYGCASNDLAIQVLGGSGYTREYPVERLYRDQRLNPIHEGTEAIHGLDLLGRKVNMESGGALRQFMALVRGTACNAEDVEALCDHGHALAAAANRFQAVTASLQQVIARDADEGLSNATTYLDAFGRLTVGWVWLEQALTASRLAARSSGRRHEHLEGKLQAAHWYFRCELPQIEPQLALLAANDRTALDTRPEWIL